MKRAVLLTQKALWCILSVLVLSVYACSDSDDDNETVDPNPNVTSKVITDEANLAGLYFLATPNTPEYSDARQNATDAGITWSDNLVVRELSTSKFISGKHNQLAAEGSGFQFKVISNKPSDGLRAAIGFNSVFPFTADADNLGVTTYNSLLAAITGLDEYQGYVLPDSSVLTGLGIKVYTNYNGSPVDITDRVSFGIYVGSKDEGYLLFSYGAVMVDREIENFAEEGFPLLVSDEEELIWSDGEADNIITAEWWIGKE
jgi:hypothetical protein